jgi:hypothetical protein
MWTLHSDTGLVSSHLSLFFEEPQDVVFPSFQKSSNLQIVTRFECSGRGEANYLFVSLNYDSTYVSWDMRNCHGAFYLLHIVILQKNGFQCLLCI